jgi:hypothetical protein
MVTVSCVSNAGLGWVLWLLSSYLVLGSYCKTRRGVKSSKSIRRGQSKVLLSSYRKALPLGNRPSYRKALPLGNRPSYRKALPLGNRPSYRKGKRSRGYHGRTNLATVGREADRTHIAVGASVVAAQRITSSAWKSTVGGIVRPRALAVLRLMTNSNLVGCSTGRSAGLAPFRILST